MENNRPPLTDVNFTPLCLSSAASTQDIIEEGQSLAMTYYRWKRHESGGRLTQTEEGLAAGVAGAGSNDLHKMS